jgi:CelD/BcsL family acetyltransferase involved in cellulose biosynthesis
MRSKGLRYLQNVLNRENPGQVVYEQVCDPAAIGAALECLIEQHRQRWAEKETYTPFEDEQFLSFHRSFAAEAMQRGWLGLYRLRVGEQTIATVYGFHYGNKFFDYQHALDNDWSKVSPGRQLISFIVQDAIARGHREYDFLCGTEKYKYSWTQTERYDQNIIWFNGLRGSLWRLALMIKQKLKRPPPEAA